MDSDALGGLVALGLSDKQARTYLALLSLGEATAVEASKASGINPRSTYDCLDALVTKGLVTFGERDGVRTFNAGSLDALMGWVEERKAMAAQLLPVLEGYRAKSQGPLVRVFRGKNSIRALWEEILRDAKPMWFYGGTMQSWKVLKNYMPQWNARREKLGLKVRQIFIDKPEIRAAFDGYKLWDARPLPPHMYSSNVWWLFGDKMALLFWNQDPFAIVIENTELAKNYRNFFDIVWKTCKPFHSTR